MCCNSLSLFNLILNLCRAILNALNFILNCSAIAVMDSLFLQYLPDNSIAIFLAFELQFSFFVTISEESNLKYSTIIFITSQTDNELTAYKSGCSRLSISDECFVELSRLQRRLFIILFLFSMQLIIILYRTVFKVNAE